MGEEKSRSSHIGGVSVIIKSLLGVNDIEEETVCVENVEERCLEFEEC